MQSINGVRSRHAQVHRLSRDLVRNAVKEGHHDPDSYNTYFLSRQSVRNGKRKRPARFGHLLLITVGIDAESGTVKLRPDYNGVAGIVHGDLRRFRIAGIDILDQSSFTPPG